MDYQSPPQVGTGRRRWRGIVGRLGLVALAVVVAVLWVRSYLVLDTIDTAWPRTELVSGLGTVGAAAMNPDGRAIPDDRWVLLSSMRMPGHNLGYLLTTRNLQQVYRSLGEFDSYWDNDEVGVQVPYWVLETPMLAAWGWLVFRRWRRRRQGAPGDDARALLEQ